MSIKYATGKGTTVVVMDNDSLHSTIVKNMVLSIAKEATVLEHQAYSSSQLRERLEWVITNPKDICAVVIPWGLENSTTMERPDWTNQPGLGFEPQFEKLNQLNIPVVCSAGDDRDGSGNRLGAYYPASSEKVVKAMGYSSICNRHPLGILMEEAESSSRAAAIIAGCIALLKSIEITTPMLVIEATTTNKPDDLIGSVRVLQIDKALEYVGATRKEIDRTVQKYLLVPVRSGLIRITSNLGHEVIRYKADGTTEHWRKRGTALTTAVKGKALTVGATGGKITIEYAK